MKFSDNAFTFGSGNNGMTTDPSNKEKQIAKTSPYVSCIGNLDKLVSYMQICLAETPDENLSKIHEGFCSLFAVLPYKRLPEIVNPLGEAEEDKMVHSYLVGLHIANEHIAKMMCTTKFPTAERLTKLNALHLNYLRALVREFEPQMYAYLLSSSTLSQGASEEFIVIDSQNTVTNIKDHFALSTIATFVNIASDYIFLLAYRTEGGDEDVEVAETVEESEDE